ncbi:MAG: thymidylate kinase [Patescibacteria group bacterium]
MSTAKLIVIDGGANVGKATQADMLMNRLIAEGYQVGKIDFPRYSQNSIGHFIRECLDGEEDKFAELDPRIVAMVYAIDRFESKKQIEEWMEEGRIIIFDRYVSSNMMHQGAKVHDADAREEFFSWVEHLEYDILGLPRPDMTIYLDIPPQDSQKLLEYIEDIGVTVVDPKEKDKLHQAKVSKCASYLANTHNQWVTVPCVTDGALRLREEIHEEVYTAVKANIPAPHATV